jgi:hypothetical protein
MSSDMFAFVATSSENAGLTLATVSYTGSYFDDNEDILLSITRATFAQFTQGLRLGIGKCAGPRYQYPVTGKI